jgi:hypothetical protein
MFTRTFLRSVSSIVLVTFTSLTLQPLQAAVMAEQKRKTTVAASQVQAVPPSRDERYSKGLAGMRELLERAETKQKRGERDDAEVSQLRSSKLELEAMETEVDADFTATEQHLKSHQLPPEILARQAAAVKEFKSKQAELKQKLKAVEEADDAHDSGLRTLKVKELSDFMQANQHQKTHTPSDPNKLPFGTPDSKVRAPIETDRAFKTSLFKMPAVHLAGPIPNGFTLPATSLPATPTAEDLAATEDIVLTPAIKALATSLNNNPVQIYNWVRNNIEYLPTYGSIQGADMTLQTKRGNSFDTASLLIGLLRAANIPARYIYGTIQIPADQAMNWVGGVTTPEAAQQLMGQGGIPNIGLAMGGQIKFIKLEHVWVQAYVDYVPSRGAVNKTPDSWIPMDASYKQYTYTQGMDLKTAVPIDAPALMTQAQTGATVDPSGWVQNVNGAAIQTALTNYQTQVQTYINTQKPNATVGDVIGSKTILPRNNAILLGTLPYKTVATGGMFTALPLPVRHQFQYNLYASALDRAMDTPLISLNQSLPSLAGKKITLSFAPATQADANLVASYLPAPNANGTPILPSQLPTSLPGYLIHLTAEFRVDGQLIATGGTFTMGEELVSSEGLFDPVNGWNFAEDNRPIAGEYIATHLDLQGISGAQLQALKDKLTATQTKLTAAQYAGITKEDLSGDILYSAVLSYFAANQAAAKVSAQVSGIIEYRKPSFGNFMASAQPLYWFGIPRNVRFPGVMMDIDRYTSIVMAKDGSPTVGYVKQSGMRLSAYEHIIPEKLFTDPLDPNRPQGVSAMKALALAASQGQKIFTLTAANQASHATLLAQVTIDPQAMQEIQNGLAAGKEVTVHQAPITQSGWTGSGYIITDPATGAGAYKIAGGANGSVLLSIVGSYGNAIGFAFFVLGLIAASASVSIVVLSLVIVSAFVLSTIAFAAAELDALENAQCMGSYVCIERIFMTVFLANLAISVAGIWMEGAWGIVSGILGLIFGDNLAGVSSRGCNGACRVV